MTKDTKVLVFDRSSVGGGPMGRLAKKSAHGAPNIEGDSMGELKEDLVQPSAYPFACGPGIECIETHISWVFLTPRDVFKVKKPVDFGFLDFTTLEARRKACEAEVRLNGRLSTGVYLGVVPLRRDSDGVHRIQGKGEVVDYAVHMRRLSDDERLDRRLARQTLTAEMLEDLAVHLARFHEKACCDDTTALYGDPERIRANVVENFEQTQRVVDEYLSPEQIRELRDYQLGFLRESALLLQSRVRQGRVREGHGDLRLEHVYLDSLGAFTVIDCIEFNERFRHGDVAADIGFLAMDLAWHQRVDLAERFVAAYARESNDFDLYGVIDFYMSYRAFVRAKVATFLAADEKAPVPLRAKAKEEARRYFLLALSAHRRSLVPPMVIAMTGVIASGKSTVASLLSSLLSAPIVEADRTRKYLLGVGATKPVHESAWSGAYDPGFTEEVYGEVFRRGEKVLKGGRPVILDASFRSVALRKKAQELAKRYGVPFLVVECHADADTCRARLGHRHQAGSAPTTSDGRLEIFDAFCAKFEPIHELSPEEHLRVDTSGDAPAILEQLKARLGSWPSQL